MRGSGSEENEDAEFTCPCSGCEKCANEFQKIWAYLLNVEKISADKMTSLEERLSKAKGSQNCKTSQQNQKESKHTESSTAKGRKINGEQETPPSQNSSKNNPQKTKPPNKPNVKSQSPATDRIPEYQNEPGASTSNRTQEGNLKKGKSSLFPPQRKTNENQHTGDTPSEYAKERPAQNDSKHYQVGGDTRFPSKIRKRGLTSAAPMHKSNSNTGRGRRRVLTSAASRQKSRTVELYLPNIAKHPDDSLGDVAAMVRECARKGGLYVITSRIVQNRFNENIVGCKITVPERQMDDALGNRVWPEGMKARKWSSEKPVNERKKQPARFQNGPRRNQRQYQREPPQSYQWEEDWDDQNEGDWPEWEQEDDGHYYNGEDDEYYEDEEYEECENWEDRYQEDDQ